MVYFYLDKKGRNGVELLEEIVGAFRPFAPWPQGLCRYPVSDPARRAAGPGEGRAESYSVTEE